MIYDHNLLTEDEVVNLKGLLSRYEGYDKLDILIEMIVSDPKKFVSRSKKVIKKETVTSEAMPEELRFCDGDKCSIF